MAMAIKRNIQLSQLIQLVRKQREKVKSVETAQIGGKIPKSMQYFFPVGPSTFRGSLLTWQARHSN